jgi:hypothetical protein
LNIRSRRVYGAGGPGAWVREAEEGNEGKMNTSKKITFNAEVFEGHKGLIAFHVPINPTQVWGALRRYFVRGTINGCPIEGEIGFRRGFHYMLLAEDLLSAARVLVGDTPSFTLAMRAPTPAELREEPQLAWARLVPRNKAPERRMLLKGRSTHRNRKKV